jgi:hypothetical protein
MMTGDNPASTVIRGKGWHEMGLLGEWDAGECGMYTSSSQQQQQQAA